MLQNTDTKLYLKDISQAYVQLITNLNRDFYIKPLCELGLELSIEKESILKVVKLLYSVPKTGNYWFKTYYGHHVNKLEMNSSIYNPCLL